MSVCAVVGSAFRAPLLLGRPLAPHRVATELGEVTLHRHPERDDAWLLFRHDLPHRWLPHQVPWRAQALALRAVGCEALLLTSSVGVLDPAVPLARPLLVDDLLWPDNRLPDGSACTLFTTPSADQGHLVLDEGLFSRALSDQVAALPPVAAHGPPPRVLFAYVGGPRTKTAAENRWWAAQGAQVNSMSIGPEAVLANELGIPVAALVVGHKYSVPDRARVVDHGLDAPGIDASLDAARQAVEEAVHGFLLAGRPVPFGNRLHRL